MGAKQSFLAETPRPAAEVRDWTRLLIGCRRDQYAASLVARAVEDCDAHLLNLNVTSPGALTGDGAPGDYAAGDYAEYPVQVELRVSHRNAESVTRSLERYGFTVLEAESSGDSGDPGRTSSNLSNLLNYLQI